MTHLTDNYAPSNSGPYCTRQAHHYYRNPQHYVGPRGRHAWDPKLGSGLIFLKLTILILGLAGETKSAVFIPKGDRVLSYNIIVVANPP